MVVVVWKHMNDTYIHSVVDTSHAVKKCFAELEKNNNERKRESCVPFHLDACSQKNKKKLYRIVPQRAQHSDYSFIHFENLILFSNFHCSIATEFTTNSLYGFCVCLLV